MPANTVKWQRGLYVAGTAAALMYMYRRNLVSHQLLPDEQSEASRALTLKNTLDPINVLPKSVLSRLNPLSSAFTLKNASGLIQSLAPVLNPLSSESRALTWKNPLPPHESVPLPPSLVPGMETVIKHDSTPPNSAPSLKKEQSVSTWIRRIAAGMTATILTAATAAFATASPMMIEGVM